MQLTGLLALLGKSPSYHQLRDSLTAGAGLADQRVLRAARPYVIAALVRDLRRPTLIVTSSVDRAYNITEQLPVWLPDFPVLRFAEPSALFYDRSPWASNTIRARLDVLGALCPPAFTDERSPALAPMTMVWRWLARMTCPFCRVGTVKK